MSNKEIGVTMKVDNSNIKKGIKETEAILKNFGKQSSTVTKELGVGFNLSKAATLGFAGAAALGVGKLVKSLNEASAAYRVQLKAENALSVAAKNNPYLLDSSVRSLKRYASELQSISEVGDEVSIGLMAQLAATERTEEEIRDIMKTAIDMSSTGAMSLDTAVQNLNKTFSGTVGKLNTLSPELSKLTKEELQNGKAVEILKNQYAGMAEGTADKTVQLANAFGDLKENIGKDWEELLSPAKKWMLDLITKANEVLNKKNELQAALKSGTDGTSDQQNLQIQSKIQDIRNLQDTLKKDDTYFRQARMSREELEKLLETRYKELSALQQSRTEKEKNEKAAIDALAAEQKKAAAAADNAEHEKLAIDLKAKSKNQLEEQIELIKRKAELEGRSTESAAVQQEILNAQIGAYLSLLEKGKQAVLTSGKNVQLVSADNEAAVNLVKTIDTQREAVEGAAENESIIQKSLDDAIKATESAKTMIEQLPIDIKPEVKIQLDIDATKEEAEKLRKALDDINDDELAAMGMTNGDKIALIESVNQKELELVKALEKEKDRIREEESQKEKDAIADKIFELNNYMQQANQIAQSIQQFATKQIETERDLRIAEIENSELSEEEKGEKILEIKKDAAEKQYKIDMFAWTASLLATTANIAQGVSKAIAQGGVAGIITGALVAAAGAIQIASVVASKPRPPSFASGGIVSGSSYSGDRIHANVNSGEMILNASQQRALWETANGRNRGVGVPNVIINNSAANMVEARPQISEDKIMLMIDARVKQSMSKGRYNDSFRQMQGGMSGTSYPI